MNYTQLARMVIAFVISIGLGASYFLKDIGFDYEFESYFPTGDPELEFYREFRETFSHDNDFVLLGIENKNGVFEPGFLAKLDALTKELDTVTNVTSVTSPTNLSRLSIGPLGTPIQIPYLHINSPERLEKDSQIVFQSEQLVQNFFGKSRNSVSLIFQTEAGLSKVKSDQIMEAAWPLILDKEFDEIHISGRIEGQKYFVEKVQEEFIFFFIVSVILLVSFLTIAFRSFWAVWVPLVVVGLTAITLLGVMTALGQKIDAMATLLPTILFVVGVSDVVHILTRYLEELRKQQPKIQAIKTAFKEVGLATFLTSVTTAIGFLTLLTANIKPVQNFGIYTAAGVLFAFFFAILFMPAIMWLMKEPNIAQVGFSKTFWYDKLSRVFIFSLRKRNTILITGAVILATCGIGISMVETDNYLLEDIPDGDKHKVDYLWFEEEFSGVRPFEMAVILKDSNKSVWNYEVVEQMKIVEHHLRNQYGMEVVNSPLTFLRVINQAVHGGKIDAYALPESEKELERLTSKFKFFKHRQEYQTLIAEKANMVRFSGRMQDPGGKLTLKRNAELAETLDAELNLNLVDYHLTGMALMIDQSNKSLAQNMISGLAIAFAIIAFIMALLFRDWRFVIISLIPNMFPLLILGGIMGFFDIDLKVSTSIIFTIAFGIAVDDTIHYLSKLKLEYNRGRSTIIALRRTTLSCGKAIIVTSLILCSGFITLISSDFTSTFYTGLLISLTLFLAVICDLLLLPPLVVYLGKNKFVKKT